MQGTTLAITEMQAGICQADTFLVQRTLVCWPGSSGFDFAPQQNFLNTKLTSAPRLTVTKLGPWKCIGKVKGTNTTLTTSPTKYQPHVPDLSKAERAFTFCITQCDGCSSVMASTLVYWPDCHVFKSQDADFILFTWAPPPHPTMARIICYTAFISITLQLDFYPHITRSLKEYTF